MSDKIEDGYELYCSSISEDSVATVLRFHLLTEYYLEQLIRVALKKGYKIVESNNYSYAQKLGILDATDCASEETVSSLKNLNKLRNRCSHQLTHSITNADIETVGSPLGKEWTQIKKQQDTVGGRISHLFGYLSALLEVELENNEKRFHAIEEKA